MKLGFVSAILPDLSLNDIAEFAFQTGYSCMELMCWPKGRAERRYAGVTHINVTNLKPAGADKTAVRAMGHGSRWIYPGFEPRVVWARRPYAAPCAHRRTRYSTRQVAAGGPDVGT